LKIFKIILKLFLKIFFKIDFNNLLFNTTKKMDNNQCDAVMCADNPLQLELEKNLCDIRMFYECEKEKIPPKYRLKDIINILDISYEKIDTRAEIQTIYYYYRAYSSDYKIYEFITNLRHTLKDLLKEPIFFENKYLTTKLNVFHLLYNWKGQSTTDYYKVGNCYVINEGNWNSYSYIAVCSNITDKSYVFQYLDNYANLRTKSKKKITKNGRHRLDRYLYTDTLSRQITPQLEQFKCLINYMWKYGKIKLWEKIKEQEEKFKLY